jgi:cysteinyl-tRNA synthetase
VALRIFNTLSGEKEDFVPQQPGKVGIYVCGPTVQDRSHVGHARVYTAFDVVVKWLRAKGFAVTYVRNFTDIDDKIIKRANEQGLTAKQLSEQNIELFLKEMAEIGVDRADVQPKVTEHIPEIIAITEKLVQKSAAYATHGNVYFAVKQYPPYGKLSKRKLDDLIAGGGERTIVGEEDKRDPLDFALWKAAKPGEPYWTSPFGEGRPGWHIECSAMSAKYLGETFDIHAGGKDLIFPHHENELAQSEAASGKLFARYWMHNGFVTLDQEKMSKSLGNFFTLREVLDRFSAEAVRTLLLGTHYRNPIDFSDQTLAQVERRVDYEYESLAKLDAALSVGKDPGTGTLAESDKVQAFWTEFEKAMDDDFNTALAIGEVAKAFALVNELLDPSKSFDKGGRRRSLQRLSSDLKRVGAVLGLWQRPAKEVVAERRDKRAKEKGIDPLKVETLISARDTARKAKDFAKSDQLRDELKNMGVEIMDTPSGTTWKIV